MRIISEFHDYYDGFMSTDQDRETLYLRKQVSKAVKRDTPEARMMPEWPICPGSRYHYRDEHPGFSGIHYSMVGFCKKVYPVVRIWHKGGNESTICFNLEQVEAFFDSILDEDEKEIWRSGKSWTWYGWSRRKSWVKFFEECKAVEDKHEDLFEKLQTPIFEYHHRYGDWTITINPLLKKLEFYRLFPGYQTYQELVMYLANLASPEKPIPKIDDETLAQIKGFDKFSFRKDKSK